MLKIAFFLLGVSICVFVRIMLREPRTLWSGVCGNQWAVKRKIKEKEDKTQN